MHLAIAVGKGEIVDVHMDSPGSLCSITMLTAALLSQRGFPDHRQQRFFFRILSLSVAADSSFGTSRITMPQTGVSEEQTTVPTVQNININTILSNEAGCCLELIHNASDPAVWIIQRSKKILWFRFNRTTFWFYDKLNALTFAKKQANDHRRKKSGQPNI